MALSAEGQHVIDALEAHLNAVKAAALGGAPAMVEQADVFGDAVFDALDEWVARDGSDLVPRGSIEDAEGNTGQTSALDGKAAELRAVATKLADAAKRADAKASAAEKAASDFAANAKKTPASSGAGAVGGQAGPAVKSPLTPAGQLG